MSVNVQRSAFDANYAYTESRWAFHYTPDPLTRFLRDRRLRIAVRVLAQHCKGVLTDRTILIVCGGVGGEGTFLRREGFTNVTVSDFSSEALEWCGKFDPALTTLKLDAESMDLPDNSYDIVMVQDGLHHLPRPALGLTEMLRISREAVVIIEPHAGLVGKVLGREWEVLGTAINYVFRWNRLLLDQCVRSYLLSRNTEVIAQRVWDHGSLVARVVNPLPKGLQLVAARAIYALLAPLSRLGNMMVGIILLRTDESPAERLTGH